MKFWLEISFLKKIYSSFDKIFYLIIIIKHTLIGTDTVLKSSAVLSEDDDDVSSGFTWLSGVFVLDDELFDGVTEMLSSDR